MKNLFFVLALLCTLAVGAAAADVSIAPVTLPGFSAGGLPPTYKLNLYATSGSKFLTCPTNNCLRPEWVGIGGFTIQVGATTYSVANVPSQNQVELSVPFAGTTGTALITWYPWVQVRIYALAAFVPAGTTYNQQPGAPGSANWARRYAASVINTGANAYMQLPTVVLPSTTDAHIGADKARYYAGFYRSNDGAFLADYVGFSKFCVPPTPNPTTWYGIQTAVCTPMPATVATPTPTPSPTPTPLAFWSKEQYNTIPTRITPYRNITELNDGLKAVDDPEEQSTRLSTEYVPTGYANLETDFGGNGNDATTTGTISSGSTALIIADLLTFKPGQWVYVETVGAAGAPLIAKILSMNRAAKQLNLSIAASSNGTGVRVQADNWNPLQEAIDTLGRPLFIPKGFFRVYNPIGKHLTFRSHMEGNPTIIVGTGDNTTQLRFMGEGDAFRGPRAASTSGSISGGGTTLAVASNADFRVNTYLIFPNLGPDNSWISKVTNISGNTFTLERAVPQITGTITSGSNQLVVSDVATIQVGTAISIPSISLSANITAINSGTKTFTLSANAGASASGAAINFPSLSVTYGGSMENAVFKDFAVFTSVATTKGWAFNFGPSTVTNYPHFENLRIYGFRGGLFASNMQGGSIYHCNFRANKGVQLALVSDETDWVSGDEPNVNDIRNNQFDFQADPNDNSNISLTGLSASANSQYITAATSQFTADHLGRLIEIDGAGTVSGNIVGVITEVISGTQIRISAKVNKVGAVSAATGTIFRIPYTGAYFLRSNYTTFASNIFQGNYNLSTAEIHSLIVRKSSAFKSDNNYFEESGGSNGANVFLKDSRDTLISGFKSNNQGACDGSKHCWDVWLSNSPNTKVEGHSGSLSILTFKRDSGDTTSTIYVNHSTIGNPDFFNDSGPQWVTYGDDVNFAQWGRVNVGTSTLYDATYGEQLMTNPYFRNGLTGWTSVLGSGVTALSNGADRYKYYARIDTTALTGGVTAILRQTVTIPDSFQSQNYTLGLDFRPVSFAVGGDGNQFVDIVITPVGTGSIGYNYPTTLRWQVPGGNAQGYTAGRWYRAQFGIVLGAATGRQFIIDVRATRGSLTPVVDFTNFRLQQGRHSSWSNDQPITEINGGNLYGDVYFKQYAGGGAQNLGIDNDGKVIIGSGGGGGGGTPVWGAITGSLSSQTDLNSALNLKANTASPALTGVPTAPTASAGTNTTQIATTAFVTTAVSGVSGGSPAIRDEGTPLGNAGTFNFIGSGVTASVSGGVATISIPGGGGGSSIPSIFNVRDYGALCNNTANDAAAFRSAIAALNANGGGTLYVPGGTCKIELGDPASDTNWTTLLDTRKGAFVFTQNNTAIRLDKNATVRVVATHIYQNLSGSGPPNYSALIAFNGASALNQVEIEGGRWTWEVGGSASLSGTLNSENGWQFLRGGTRSLNIHDTVIDGFPQGGTNTGYSSGGFSLQDMRIDNIRVLSYGGGGHDGFWYLQGRTIMTRSYFTPARSFYSHAFYSGADRPGSVIRNNVFENFTQTADNKYPIQIYSESGGEIIDITIEGNEFRNCHIWFIAQKNDGATAVRNLKVIGNFGNGNYTASGFTSAYYAIEATRCHECLFQGNRINDYFQSMRLEFPQNTRVIGNSVNIAKFGLLLTAGQNCIIADNNIQGISVSGSYGIYFSGNKMSVDNNTVLVASNRTGIYALGGSGLGDYRVTNNTVTGDGAAFAVTTGTITDLLVNGNQFDMTTGQPMQFPFGGTCNGCVISNNTIKTGSTLDTGAFLIDSNGGSFFIENNKFSVGNIYWNSTSLVPVNNQILTGQFSNTTGVVRGRMNTIGGRVDTNVANSGTSYTPFAGLYAHHILTLNNNVTIGAPTGATNGDVLNFTLIQDGTGGRTVTWNAAFKVSCSLTTTLSTKSGISFRYDGTHWVQTSACVTGL